MALDPQIVRRDKSSKHVRQPGEIYQGIVTSVRDDGNVYVKIPSLSITSGPVMPLNSSPSNRLSVGDVVACSFNNSYNSSLVVFGSATQASDDYSISRYANTAERDLLITSPQEGRTVYILDSDELQIYNGTSWITVIDTGESENLSIETLNVSGTSTLSASTSIGSVSSTEISYLNGVTGEIQGQLDSKAPLTQTLRIVTGSTDIPTSADNGKIVVVNTSSGSVTITINGSLGLLTGQKIDFVWQGAATSVSFIASGLTGGGLSATPGLNLRARYSAASLLCTTSNTYILIGDLAA